MYPLSHKPLSINPLHSHRHLSLFHRCLLLQTLTSNLQLHLHVSCHFLCLVSLVLNIKLNTLILKSFIISGTHILAYGSLILLQLSQKKHFFNEFKHLILYYILPLNNYEQMV